MLRRNLYFGTLTSTILRGEVTKVGKKLGKGQTSHRIFYNNMKYKDYHRFHKP